MKLIEDYRIVNKFNVGFRRELSDINEIVLHHTAGGPDIEALIQWELSEERRKVYEKNIGMVHYFICHNGDVHQVADLSLGFWHADNKNDPRSIAIELLHQTGPFTEEQYQSLFTLMFVEIERQCNIQILSGHDYHHFEAYKKYKGCPSEWFDWPRLEAEMTARNIFWQSIEWGNYILS